MARHKTTSIFDRLPEGIFRLLGSPSRRHAWDILVHLYDQFFSPDVSPVDVDGLLHRTITMEIERFILNREDRTNEKGYRIVGPVLRVIVKSGKGLPQEFFHREGRVTGREEGLKASFCSQCGKLRSTGIFRCTRFSVVINGRLINQGWKARQTKGKTMIIIMKTALSLAGGLILAAILPTGCGKSETPKQAEAAYSSEFSHPF